MPRHGEERNHHVRREFRAVEGRTASGRAVTLGDGHSYTVSERWCMHCADWFEVAGIVGALEWAVTHGGGECPPAGVSARILGETIDEENATVETRARLFENGHPIGSVTITTHADADAPWVAFDQAADAWFVNAGAHGFSGEERMDIVRCAVADARAAWVEQRGGIQ